jgi:hypothetical protein
MIEEEQKKAGRPQGLTILCIISFLGSALAGLSYFMMYSSYHEILPQLTELGSQFPGVEWLLSVNRSFFITGFVLYALSFFGVRLIWNMRKAGFHFYTGSQIMLVLMPVFYIPGFPIPFVDGLITGVFIFLYSRFYRLLH